MGRKTTSLKLSNEIRELLHKLALYTGKQKSEIVEEAILHYIKTNYGEMLSKEADEILKEGLEKPIVSIQRGKEIDTLQKLLIKFINSHIVKTRILFEFVYSKDKQIVGVSQQLYRLENYESNLLTRILNLSGEIEDQKLFSNIIDFVKNLNIINAVDIRKISEDYIEFLESWELFNFITKHLPNKYIKLKKDSIIKGDFENEKSIIPPPLDLFEIEYGIKTPEDYFIIYIIKRNLKEYLINEVEKLNNLEIDSDAKNTVNKLIVNIITDNLDYYLKPILEKINKENNTDFKDLKQLFEKTSMMLNDNSFRKEIEKVRINTILDFIKYLEETRDKVRKNEIPNEDIKEFLIKRIEHYVNESQYLSNFLMVKKIYSELFNSITKDYVNSIINDVMDKAINYFKEKFKDRLVKLEYKDIIKYYYEINKKDIESFKEELKRVLIPS